MARIALGIGLGATLSFFAHLAAAQDGGCGLQVTDGACVQTPVDYSSATSCCGPVIQIECLPPSELYPDCNSTCDHAWCIPASILEAAAGAATSSFLRDCPATDGAQYKCVPEGLFESVGNVKFMSCDSIAGGEGRCIPRCLNAVAGIVDYLPQDVCLAEEVCAPCYDPRTGDPTGACSIGCDPGPDPLRLKVTFPSCCPLPDGGSVGGDGAPNSGSSFVGMCVPRSIVPSNVLPALAKEDCTNTDAICVPKNLDVAGLSQFACFHTPVVEGGEGGPPDAGATGGAGGAGTGGSTGDAATGGASTGGTTATGGANLDAGLDGGGKAGAKDEGSCGCRLADSRAGSPGALALLGMAATAFLARGRRRAGRSRR